MDKREALLKVVLENIRRIMTDDEEFEQMKEQVENCSYEQLTILRLVSEL